MTVDNNVTVSNDLEVKNNLTAKNISITDDLSVDGNLSVGGEFNLNKLNVTNIDVDCAINAKEITSKTIKNINYIGTNIIKNLDKIYNKEVDLKTLSLDSTTKITSVKALGNDHIYLQLLAQSKNLDYIICIEILVGKYRYKHNRKSRKFIFKYK